MANPWDNDPVVNPEPWANDPVVQQPEVTAASMDSVPAFLRPPVQPAAAGPYAGNPTVPVASPKVVNPWDADPAVELPNRSAGNWANDIGTSFGKGVYTLFDGIAGLGDLLSGGSATPWLAEHGMDSKAARDKLNAELSPQAKQQAAEVANAQGFADTAKAMLTNPAYTAGLAIESLFPMVAGGAVGRGVGLGAKALGLGAKAAATVGTGVGEGLLSAGQQAAQTVQQTGDLTAEQTALALGSGALTGAIGAGAGRIASRLGFGDIDAQLAGIVGPASTRGLAARVGGGLVSEGGEEVLQSAQEQAASNLTLGNPIGQGVANAAAQGGVLGGLMGGAFNGVSGFDRSNLTMTQAEQARAQAAVDAMNNPASQPPAAGLQAQIQAGVQDPVVPFAGSVNINGTLETMWLSPEQKVQAVALLSPSEQSIEEARRGVLPLAEQQRLASLIGANAKDIAKTRKIGQAWNAETLISVTNAAAQKYMGITELQQKIAAGEASDIEKAQFLTEAADFSLMSRSILGAKAEAGRALAAGRRQIFSLQEAQRVLEGNGLQSAEDLAAALGKAMKSGGLQNGAKLLSQQTPGIWDYYFRAALLSNPQTHVVNATSNAGMLANSVVERSIAATISKVKGLAGLKNEIAFHEPADMLFGMAVNLGSASKAAAKAFGEGQSPIIGQPANTEGTIASPKGVVEQTFSVPFRSLAASDTWFAQLNYAAELRALARSQALIERTDARATGKPPIKLSTRVAELVADPTPAMVEAAGLHARKNTFNAKSGAVSNGINIIKKKYPWLNTVLPFVRTPINILGEVTERTPFAVALKSVREDLMAGGRAQDMALAKMTWGASVMIVAGMLASAGYITGSPPGDEEEKRSKLATGWKPYSIKAGDTYYSYQRFDPFSTWLGLAADISQMDGSKPATDLAMQAMGSFAANIVNKSFLIGLSDLTDFASQPERNAEWYGRKMAGTIGQPISLLSGIAANNDPYARRVDSALDAWKYRVPGLRETLPPQIDQFGRPVQNVERSGIEMLNPVAESKESTNVVRAEAARLKWAPSKPTDTFTIAKREVQMTPEQLQEYSELSGIQSYNLISKVMQSPAYQRADDDTKRKILDKMSDLSRDMTKAQMARSVLTGDRSGLDKLRQNLKPTDTSARP